MIISKQEEKKAPGSDRKNPAIARIKERYLLTGAQSSKQVYHVVLDLEESPLAFQVGDSIGIFPQNDPQDVERIIAKLNASAEHSIIDPRTQESLALWDFISYKANLARLTSSFLKLFHEKSLAANDPSPLGELLLPENKAALAEYLQAHEVIDLWHAYPQIAIEAQEFCAVCSPLLPRFYSVASSPLLFSNEVHLTVALTVYALRDQQRYGVTSHFLCHLAEEYSTPVPVYVQPAHNFRLPQEDNTPIIMVGPGTGVAPFRAFLQERIHRESLGRNWLFFGERHQAWNYYYSDYFEKLSSDGRLKLNTSFSRDGQDKKYVQHSMYENAKEIFTWLEEGAHFYVCGNAEHMAKDVEAMVHAIVQEQGAMSPEAAKAYVKALRAQKRYLTDVY
ncbi:MAG TPA: sulfite reductase [Rhabdochlamydiaceae bacterium]|jgi:sulfite reductase (NADPH) flavoprotein alpha-component